MTILFNIQGAKGNVVEVSRNGELFVRPVFSLAEKRTIIDSNAVNFVHPQAGFKTIITGLIVNTDRNVGVNGALIEVYEAIAEDSTVVSKAILSFDLIKNQNVVTAPILIETTGGTFINAKSNDFNANVTLLCYFSKI